ncbi:unnamed protein product [Paramecium primaurelia]|uniref:Cytochrome b5 heme-binding domain-containing protein n=1 Tax=Paramecium primaurelia TaxID=5886 RepID=A0A8S1MSN7_PARPR|nr:unnamed protein product [Paramecium primaurelia]
MKFLYIIQNNLIEQFKFTKQINQNQELFLKFQNKYFIQDCNLLMEDKITSIITDDRIDEILHLNATKEELLVILNYIIMDYKKFQMTDKILLQSQKMQKLTLEECIANRFVYLFVPGVKNSMDSNSQKEVRYTYEPKDGKICKEKYRNGRKTESTEITFEQINKMLSSFNQSTGVFLSSKPNFAESKFIAPLLPQEEVAKREKVQVKGGQMLYVQQPRKNRPAFRNYTAEEVSKHNKPGDVWTVLNGKVYDITLYMDYHPGGVEKLMLGAGKDCTKLFNQFHSWVNGHAFLEQDYIGNLKH